MSYKPVKYPHSGLKADFEFSRRATLHKNFMVDFETLGLTPNKSIVLQVAIVEFDDLFMPTDKTYTGYFPIEDQINRLGLQADANTVAWWNSDPDKIAVMDDILEKQKQAGSLDNALLGIYKFIGKCCAPDKLNENNQYASMFWAKPTLFDYPFMDGLFMNTGNVSPFHYRNVIDMSSYIIGYIQQSYRLLKNKNISLWEAQQLYWRAFNIIKSQVGKDKANAEAHNALNDCVFQINWLREIIFNTNYYLQLKDGELDNLVLELEKGEHDLELTNPSLKGFVHPIDSKL